MQAILIVVDMLNDFFERSPELAKQRPRLVAGINSLVRTFRTKNLPIFWVRQEFARDLHDAFLEMRANNVSITVAGTAGCELLSDLEYRQGDSVLVKKRYSAFFGTDLDEQLSKVRPKVLVIAGVNTHACVRMTTIDAYQRDYHVIVASECVASGDTEHHDVTLRYLRGNVAQVLANADVVATLSADA